MAVKTRVVPWDDDTFFVAVNDVGEGTLLASATADTLAEAEHEAYLLQRVLEEGAWVGG